MCTKSRSKCIWLLCSTLVVISILIVCGISYVYLKPMDSCSWAHTNYMSAEEFKHKYGDKLYDDISRRYIDVLQRIYPTMLTHWKSLLPDMAEFDEPTKELKDILEKAEENFERMKVGESLNITERVELIRTYKELQNRFYVLIFVHGTMPETVPYRQFKKAETLKFFTDICESWRDMFVCVPEEYLKIYPDFVDIQKVFERITESKSENSYDVRTMMFKLDKFFQFELFNSSIII